MTAELLPCPLCGAAVHMQDDRGWEVGCTPCQLYMLPLPDISSSQEATIAAWNTRANLSARPGVGVDDLLAAVQERFDADRLESLAPAGLSDAEREALEFFDKEFCDELSANGYQWTANNATILCNALRRLAAAPAGDGDVQATDGLGNPVLMRAGTIRNPTRGKPAPSPVGDAHPDDLAVDRFAAAMKAKMAKQRAKGYGGWDDVYDCPKGRLARMLSEHIQKGDPVDVGNFAMMLFNRGEATSLNPPLIAEAPPAPVGAGDGWKYDSRYWQEGTYGNANVVTYNGEDVKPVCRIEDATLRATVIAKHNATVATAPAALVDEELALEQVEHLRHMLDANEFGMCDDTRNGLEAIHDDLRAALNAGETK